MIRIALLICIGLCTMLLSITPLFSTWWIFSPVSMAIGTIWFLFELRPVRYVRDVAFVVMTILSALQLISGISSLLFLITALLSLAAWDLSRFCQRLKDTEISETRSKIEKRHMKRLAIVIILGLSIAGLAFTIRLQFNFYILITVAFIELLTIYLIAHLFFKLRSENT